MDLTPTAIIVLGLLELGEATPYDLKVRMADSVGNFWSVPHSALYAEPERLAKAGLAEERREEGGRRRRVFSITDAGRRALDEWRAEPTSERAEIRYPALLKLFFGADPKQIAAAQLPQHRERLARYEEIRKLDDGTGPRGPFLALDAGILHERKWIEYWESVG
jgi:DNA-binding PadR family transcriptional regulator